MKTLLNILSIIIVTFLFSCGINQEAMTNNSYSYDDVKRLKGKDIKEAKEIAQSWLNKKSDSLHIPILKLSELRFNPDEGTIQLVDMYEEKRSTMSDKEKSELINEIEKSGFYFINSSYLNIKTKKTHTLKFSFISKP